MNCFTKYLCVLVVTIGLGASSQAAIQPLSFSTLAAGDDLSDLFSGGITFENIDGNGLEVTMVGTAVEGSIGAPVLTNSDTVMSISASKGAVKVDYNIAFTFSSAVDDFGFASLDITNQETLELNMSSNPGGGNWTGNFIQFGSYGDYSGLGTPTITGTGPSGGNPVSGITVTDSPMTSFIYRYTHNSGNELDEGFSLVVVPELSSLFLIPIFGLAGLLFRHRS